MQRQWAAGIPLAQTFFFSLFQPSADWIKPTTLGNTICFIQSINLNIKLIQKHPHRKVLNNVGPNVWVHLALVKLIHEINHHTQNHPESNDKYRDHVEMIQFELLFLAIPEPSLLLFYSHEPAWVVFLLLAIENNIKSSTNIARNSANELEIFLMLLSKKPWRLKFHN